MTAQLSATFQYGVASAVAKSYAYDESQYVQTDPVNFSIGGAVSSNAKFVSFTNKQLRSITVALTGTSTIATTGDTISLYLATPYAVAFGTATGVSQLNTAVGTGTLYTTSTLLGTGMNLVTILNVFTVGSGQSGVAGTGSFAGGTAAASPLVVAFPGGTFTVVVSTPQGTNTQTGYVFNTGPNGGLSIGPGDVLILQKSSTDTLAFYQGEMELTFTPGGSVTR